MCTVILHHNNEDLCKEVEGLQLTRLNEVEELSYLRWISLCSHWELYDSNNQSRTRISSSREIVTSKRHDAAGVC